MTSDPFFYGFLKQYANENRNHQTVIGCYIADFICIRARTIIEVDGGYHAQEEQKIRDIWRTEDLNKMGYDVLRFKNEEITSDLTKVLDKIFNHIVHKI